MCQVCQSASERPWEIGSDSYNGWNMHVGQWLELSSLQGKTFKISVTVSGVSLKWKLWWNLKKSFQVCQVCQPGTDRPWEIGTDSHSGWIMCVGQWLGVIFSPWKNFQNLYNCVRCRSEMETGMKFFENSFKVCQVWQPVQIGLEILGLIVVSGDSLLEREDWF